MSPKVVRFLAVLLALCGAGSALVWLLSPLEFRDGFVIFFLGINVGVWLSPARAGSSLDEQAERYWSDLDTGERLARYFPAIMGIVFGGLALTMAIHFSRVETDWKMIGVSVLMMLIGGGYLVAIWRKRLS